MLSEAQLQLLVSAGRHPATGEILDRAYPQSGSARRTVAAHA